VREIVECRLSDMVGARVRQLLTCVGVHFATKPAFIHVGSNRQEMHHVAGAFGAKDLTKRAAKRRALHRLGPLGLRAFAKCALRGAKGVNKSLQKSVAAEKRIIFTLV
jgi:hypothetical protein